MIDTPGEQTGMCEFSIVFPSYSMPHFSFRAHSRNMHLLHGYLNRAGPPTSIVSPPLSGIAEKVDKWCALPATEQTQ